MRSYPRRLAVVLGVFILSVATVWAQEAPKNSIRAGIAYHDPQGETTIEDSEFGDLNLDWDSATGFFASYERRFSKLLGLEIMATRSEPDWNVSAVGGSATSGATFTAATAGLNIHFFGRGAIDLYAAPLIGYAFYGDDIEDADLGDSYLYGAAVGIDIGFGKRGLAFTASARYLKSEAEVEGEDVEIDFDPFILTAGLAFRF
jgi:hypothetical protein